MIYTLLFLMSLLSPSESNLPTRMEGRKEGKKEGRKEGRKEVSRSEITWDVVSLVVSSILLEYSLLVLVSGVQ